MQIKLSDKFYLFKDLITLSNKSFIKDIDQQIDSGNLCLEVPKYQTYNNLYNIMKHKNNWKTLYNAIKDKVLSIDKNIKLHSSWANVSKESSCFINHTHPTEFTAVYYLKNNLSCFGTIIEDSVIIPGEENSLLIFDPKIKHSIVNTPNNIYKNIGPRYSIVFDFISDRK